LKRKKFVEAEKYANLSRDIALLLDLGDYTAYASNFLLAVEKREKASLLKMSLVRSVAWSVIETT
jgi:hypothetical protein